MQHHRGSLFTYFFASGTPPGEHMHEGVAAAATAAQAEPLQFAAEAVTGVCLPVLGPKATPSLAATTALCARFAAAANYTMEEATVWGVPTAPSPTAMAAESATTASRGGAAGEVVETVEVEEHQGQGEAGRYTAFADGSVHVAFADRTMISLQSLSSTLPGRERAQVLMPDGSRKSVPLHAAPAAGLLGDTEHGRLGLHLAAAAKFQEWACRSPAERIEAAMRDQARRLVIEAEAAKTQRFLSLQTMQRSGSLPGQQQSEGAARGGRAGAVGGPDDGARFVEELQAKRWREGLDLSNLLARNRVTMAEIHELVR